jgi:DnaK suppressor protein
VEGDALAEARARLVDRRDALIAEGDVQLEPNRSDPGSSRRDDDAQPLNEMNQSIASHRNRERAIELRRVRRALARLDEDPEDFGLCETCEEPIAARRLAVMPWAERCLACEEKREPDRGGRRSLTDYV